MLNHQKPIQHHPHKITQVYPQNQHKQSENKAEKHNNKSNHSNNPKTANPSNRTKTTKPTNNHNHITVKHPNQKHQTTLQQPQNTSKLQTNTKSIPEPNTTASTKTKQEITQKPSRIKQQNQAIKTTKSLTNRNKAKL